MVNGQRPVDILKMLFSGRARAFWLTIPEGKWASEIVQEVAVHWPTTSRDLPTLVAQPARWKKQVPFPLQGHSLEGYLFPDTYRFSATASASQIISTMLARFRDTCWKAYQAEPPKDGRSLYEVLVLASTGRGGGKAR